MTGTAIPQSTKLPRKYRYLIVVTFQNGQTEEHDNLGCYRTAVRYATKRVRSGKWASAQIVDTWHRPAYGLGYPSVTISA